MATRSHTTFKKRQKELARLDKQREKVAKRAERKLVKQPLGENEAIDADYLSDLTGAGDDYNPEPSVAEAPPTNS